MTDTYIKNRGTMKTIIHHNNHKQIKELDWDADYDGDKANIHIDVNNGRNEKHYKLQLDNDNLADLLNIPSVNMPLEKRLLRDFKKTKKTHDNFKPIYIEFDLPTPEMEQNTSYITNPETEMIPIEKDEPYFTHISSPLQNEEFFIPLHKKKIHQTYRKTYRKHKKSRKPRTTKSYTVYRRLKTTPYSRRHKPRKYTRRSL